MRKKIEDDTRLTNTTMPMIRAHHMQPVIVNEQAGINETINTRLCRRVQVVRVVSSAPVLPDFRNDPHGAIERPPTRWYSLGCRGPPHLHAVSLHHPMQPLVRVHPLVSLWDEEGQVGGHATNLSL